VINGLVGESGVRPTLKAVELGKEVGLANKESLVVAGQFIDTSKIFPIDSEHFAIWELIKGRRDEVVKIVITASGGAVRTLPLSHFPHLTPEEVLDHPNWEMGAKITIDSSTMVNKLFELLEAYWLFKIPNLEGVIEPTSTLHGLIELKDGGVMAHLSRPDMALPIAHFLKRDGVERVVPSLPLVGLQLQLLPIEEERYPVWKIAPLLLRQPQLGVVVNTINDRMVELFLNRKLPFPAIATTILEGVERFEGAEVNSLSQLWELKREVERWLDKRIKGGKWSGV
jgi:1-deoxy-D-xylulose-5-phosphate reductoisomerase